MILETELLKFFDGNNVSNNSVIFPSYLINVI